MEILVKMSVRGGDRSGVISEIGIRDSNKDMMRGVAHPLEAVEMAIVKRLEPTMDHPYVMCNHLVAEALGQVEYGNCGDRVDSLCR